MSAFIQAASLERSNGYYWHAIAGSFEKYSIEMFCTVVDGSFLHSISPVYTRQHVAEFGGI